MNKQKYASAEIQNLFKLIQMMNHIEKSFNKHFEDYELTLTQYWLLTNLHQEYPSSLRISQVATALDSSHQNIKQICQNLEKKGWLRLHADPMDKRSTILILSEQFIEKRFELDLLFDRLLKKLYYRLSKEDFYRVSIMLERLNENIEDL